MTTFVGTGLRRPPADATNAPTRRLVLSRADATFDPGSHAALAPWCFQGAEDAYPDWQDLPFEDVLSDPAVVASDSARLNALANSLVPRFAAEMNARHGTAYGERYWRVLLMPWLLRMAQFVWKRWCHVDTFIGAHPEEPFRVAVFGAELSWVAVDVRDMWRNLFSSHAFNHWLCGKIVQNDAPPHWRVDRVPPESLMAPMAWPQAKARRTIVEGMRRWYGGLRCRKVAGIGLWALPMSILLNILPAKAAGTAPPRRTEEAARDGFPPGFVDLLVDALWSVVPRSLGADFARLDRRGRSRRTRAGRVNLIGPVLVVNEEDKFALAHAAENGELIFAAQHGAGGFQELTGVTAEIDYRCDAFFTWGWESHSDYAGRFVPLPSPLLSAHRNGRRRTNSSLLFIGGGVEVFAKSLLTYPQSKQYLAYRDWKKRFLVALPATVQAAIRYRPYVGQHDTLRDDEYMTEHLPALEVCGEEVNERALHGSLMECRLAVVDQPSTTFCLAMAANVPTVGYWDPEIWRISRQAAPVFERLVGLGVICHKPEDAAGQVARIWDDVDAWWMSAPVQEARAEFCRRYAQTDRFWIWSWIKALWRL